MEEQQVKMKVQGMNCTGCEEHVVKALENAGANNVRAIFRQGEVRFIVPEERELSRFSNAVAETGYQPEGIEILSAGNPPNLGEEGEYRWDSFRWECSDEGNVERLHLLQYSRGFDTKS
jgi:mercuric reductase